MEAGQEEVKITVQQQRILKSLFKFRFISAQLAAQVMGISRQGVYQALEALVDKKLVSKVYEKEFRIDRKAAYYYLNKQGVTAVRRLLDVKESTVHALYKNDVATPEFIERCLAAAHCYAILNHFLPADTNIFTKAEINRFSQFPKNRPDLYIRTPDNKEAVIVVMDDKPLYIARKRFDEIIRHSEDEGWDGDYPHIGFILRHGNDKNSFLFTARKKLENMGMDEDEIYVLATDLKALGGNSDRIWSSVFSPKSFVRLFE
ncbi:MAG TPA: MarR family winged helix-turn-helix transcriptional regulator [Candidatus Saccharimonadales bacterium]|nr:MarR family winged helix-turn-helix transcriptional regulator [Candidatus Saccharimonadales bacterium]